MIKLLYILFFGLMQSSFVNIRENNTLTDEHLKGHIKSITEYNSYRGREKEVLHSIEKSLFDEKGNRTFDTVTFVPKDNAINSFSVKWTYAYNGKGRKTEENIYNKDGSLSWKTVYTYDTSGAVIETNRYHADGRLEQRMTYKYDDNGNAIEAESYNQDVKNGDYVNKYDNDNRMIGQFNLDTFNGRLGNTKQYWKYNDSGATVEFTEYEGNATIPAKRITYTDIAPDQQGNWIKRTETKNESGHTMVTYFKREIIYY
jgi:hypothetical protein